MTRLSTDDVVVPLPPVPAVWLDPRARLRPAHRWDGCPTEISPAVRRRTAAALDVILHRANGPDRDNTTESTAQLVVLLTATLTHLEDASEAVWAAQWLGVRAVRQTTTRPSGCTSAVWWVLGPLAATAAALALQERQVPLASGGTIAPAVQRMRQNTECHHMALRAAQDFMRAPWTTPDILRVCAALLQGLAQAFPLRPRHPMRPADHWADVVVAMAWAVVEVGPHLRPYWPDTTVHALHTLWRAFPTTPQSDPDADAFDYAGGAHATALFVNAGRLIDRWELELAAPLPNTAPAVRRM